MGLRVSFDLDDNDLKHFRLIMQQASKAACRRTRDEIVESAESLLRRVDSGEVPRFIRDRLDNLRLMIRMLADPQWRLPAKEAARVYNALAYFCEPEDLIPDQIPGLGFLDDAIMIELVVRELRHELEAYRDFCDFRDRQPSGSGAEVSREDWLENRRRELQSRMRRRRKRNGAGERRPLRLL